MLSFLQTTTRLVTLPGRFIGISSFEVRPYGPDHADGRARRVSRSEPGACADDGWEDSEDTGEVSTSCVTAVLFEAPAVG